jgi:peptide/nickel transport system substrate-binding protein
MGNPGKLKGELAESWEVSPDGKEITFHLRKNVVFASGNKLIAEDVRFTVDRGLNIPGGISWLFNVMGVNSVDQVTVVDDHTVKFTLERPNALFLPSLALEVMSIVDSVELKKHATDDDPYGHEWLNTHVASTGAYHLESYKPGEEVVLAANKNYWGGDPKTERVAYKIIPSEATRILLLKNGTVDISLFISPEQVLKQMMDQKGIRVVSIPTPATESLAMNTSVEPTNNPLFRKALAHATPYGDLIENVLYGYGSMASSPVPTATNWHRDVSPYNYDPEKAKELLKEGGFAEGTKVTLSYRIDNPVEEAVAVYLKDAYSKVGVDLQIDEVAASRFEKIRQTREYQMALIYWIPYVNDPIYQLNFNYASASDCCNYAEYKNPDYDALLANATVEQDTAKQEGMVVKLQEMIIEDSPIIYLYHPNRITCMRESVTGYVYYPDQLIQYHLISKD